MTSTAVPVPPVPVPPVPDPPVPVPSLPVPHVAPRLSAREVRARVDALPDPELPVIGLGDLGVVHSVGPGRDGALEAHIMPTFLGCPAMDVITSAVREVLEACGHPDGRVRVVLAPPWTSDRITPAGRDKLAAHGIVPPSASTGGGPARLPFPPSCPHCGSRATRPESLFGPTRCQTVGRCLSCHETFSQFITL